MIRRPMLARACAIVIVAPAMLLAAACDDGGSDDPPPADAPPSLDFLLTPVAGETPATPTTGLAAATPVVGLMTLFVESLNGSVASTYRVSYNTTLPDGEEGDDYVVYSRPPLARIDITDAGEEERTQTIVSREPDGTVQCNRDGSDWECIVISLLGDPLVVSAGPIVFPGATDVAAGTITETGERAIAGQQARCYELTPDDETGTLEYCLGPGGVPLYASSSLVTAEATEYSLDVTDADFVLPE